MTMPAFEIIDNKVIIHIHETICENGPEIVNSQLFREILDLAVAELVDRQSHLLEIFPGRNTSAESIQKLVQFLTVLSDTETDANDKEKALQAYASFLKDPHLFNSFIEFLYNFWRKYDRFIICDSMGRNWDKRPYRTFNATIGHLTHLIRGMYRDIQEAVTGDHPRIYRQVAAGAEMAAISVNHAVPFYDSQYDIVNSISMIRQVLINPPLILNPLMNKRKGEFVRINQNPLELFPLEPADWLCYPAKVGRLLILVYIHKRFIDLGLSLCNLFELASDDDLMQKPDAIYFYGVPSHFMDNLKEFPTVFHEDEKNNLLVAAVPNKDEFGYFGYLKKMILTLHNITMMKQGFWPFHGALVQIILKGNKSRTMLFVGDTGAGKSETLEALRECGQDLIQDLFVIADDMGSIQIADNGDIIGYGTEIGAFLRLDDLKPGYAFGQIDRAIIMNPTQTNARIILPVTNYETVIKGHKIDYIFYANNYEAIDDDHPILEKFTNQQDAFHVFREGTVMSKGTTTSTGIVHSYFANIFGPVQYKELHDKIADRFFKAFFDKNVYVGQIRTRLGLKGYEYNGPELAAQRLLSEISGA